MWGTPKTCVSCWEEEALTLVKAAPQSLGQEMAGTHLGVRALLRTEVQQAWTWAGGHVQRPEGMQLPGGQATAEDPGRRGREGGTFITHC